MNKCYVQFLEDDTGATYWVCRAYLMCRGVKFKEESTRCYHYRCPGRQDKPKVRHIAAVESQTQDVCIQEPVVKLQPCANPDCTNAVLSENSTYCTLKCRKRRNTKDYRARKRFQKNLTRP